MCGINGIILKSGQDYKKLSNDLSKMNFEIVHRGPDQDGFFLHNSHNFHLGMAMRRLSIIDLNTGKQPISSENNSITIVFNGEIYNYLELKKSLEEKGIRFNTTSDTEVILKLYEIYGTESFSMLDGMFAFSIYDDNIKKTFIARDFFGEKPLYFTKDEHRIIWASELKSIISVLNYKPNLSKTGLSLYFQLTYIPAPYTIYDNIHKLEANNYLEIDTENFNLKSIEVNQKFSKDVSPDITFKEAKNLTHDLVVDSVSSRSIADVPLGTFLSGGVDSSIVSWALANQTNKKIDTFSIGFDKKSFDESDKSRAVAKIINSNHHEFIVSAEDLKDNVDSILLNFDEPFADSSSLPTYLVANKTRQHVKVALTGDGGDEVFGGYNKYYIGKLNTRYSSFIPEKVHNAIKSFSEPFLATKDDKRGYRFKAKRLLNAINYDGDFYYNIVSLAYQPEEVNRFLKDYILDNSPLNYFKNKIGSNNQTLTDFRNIDKLLSLEGDMLVKVDRTSMLTSLESRAPFLNKKLWNFTSQVPETYLMQGWNKKFLLKESFKEYFPKDFLDKSKKGFGVPVGDWLRGHLSKELESYIEPEFLKVQNIFITDEIIALIRNHLSGKEDNTFRVWTYYCFQKWYKETYLKF
ncbi:asparagine synthase (glutamine-hydrolysing) [Christiangramia gaetbulicola]|uniref:asparagine synthase (glutamine-hydrolyzing) n=1 Tax=Christiangramia gaetbulicola TaxID=703340 RepID=A0A2T6AFP9_9FLAO|nr:asparagine synthase (glutamine-hydrolyzing) [Christiangramia gaetbulicola]PTX42631.1 asparagine synthase (glutamine-hydrolysing) [Christiangramia gaetbulicola]